MLTKTEPAANRGELAAAFTDVPGASTEIRRARVCFISPLGYGLYDPQSGVPYGGAELQFFLMSQRLATDPGFHVSVLTTVQDGAGTEECGGVTLIKRQAKGRLHRGQVLSLRTARGYGASFMEMLTLLRSIDADVYLHAGAGVEVGAYAMMCSLLRRRFVYVVASSADLREAYGKVEGPLRWLFPLGVRLAHAVVCRTREQQSWLRDFHRRDGVLIRTGHPRATEAAEKKTTMLWVGRAHPLKQPQLFIRLARELPGQRCEMVMMHDPRHEALLNEVRELVAGVPNLTLLEDVPWERVGAYFSRAKVLVNTSTYEGFPNTFVEAAMRGTPILSWAVDPDHVLTEHRIGACAAGSFDQLLASARELCSSDEVQRQYGTRAAAYAASHHDLDRSVAELKALLGDVLHVGDRASSRAGRT